MHPDHYEQITKGESTKSITILQRTLKQMITASTFKLAIPGLEETDIANFTQKASSLFSKHAAITFQHKETSALI